MLMSLNVVLFLVVYLAVLVGIPVLVGVYVFRDASRRGMNAVLWTLVAVLAPVFVGLIIYLLVRGSYSDLKCPNCAAPVTEQYLSCPRCGARLKASCPNCAAPVEPDWKVCPHCGNPLPEFGESFTPPVRRQDKTLWKILLVVILIAILLILAIFWTGRRELQMCSATRSRPATRPGCSIWSTCLKWWISRRSECAAVQACSGETSRAWRCPQAASGRESIWYLLPAQETGRPGWRLPPTE